MPIWLPAALAALAALAAQAALAANRPLLAEPSKAQCYIMHDSGRAKQSKAKRAEAERQPFSASCVAHKRSQVRWPILGLAAVAAAAATRAPAPRITTRQTSSVFAVAAAATTAATAAAKCCRVKVATSSPPPAAPADKARRARGADSLSNWLLSRAQRWQWRLERRRRQRLQESCSLELAGGSFGSNCAPKG